MKKTIDLMKPAEVAKILRINVRTVYLMVERGELPCTRIGTNTVRVPRAALERYIDNATS